MRYLGKNIRYLRESSGYSQKKLSELLKITPSSVSNIENRGTTTLEMLIKLSELFEVDINKLLLENLAEIDNPKDYQQKIAYNLIEEEKTEYNDSSSSQIIEAQKQTIEVQQKLIRNLEQQLNER